MEFSSSYDYVILGEHPAGLWAARRLLTMEKKVLILPLGKDSGINALPKRVASDFGWTEQDWVDRGADSIQILTRDRRFKLGQSIQDFESEFKFQFGSPWSKDSTLPLDLVRGLAYLGRGAETGPVFSSEAGFWIKRAFDTLYFEKEYGHLTRRMIRHLLELGAHVAKPRQLKQVFVDKNVLVGVQLLGNSRMISTKAGLVCAHYDYVKGYLSETTPALSQPLGWYFDVKFECSTSVIPAGLTNRMVYVEDGAPILEITQEGKGFFHLRTPLPLHEETLSRGFQRRLAERMLKVCEKLIPDLEYNLIRVSPDVTDPDKAESLDLPRLYPFEDLIRVPIEKLFYGGGNGLGFQSSFVNLYLANEESNPREGLWGAYHSVDQIFEQKPASH
jgi:hypothetical protein